MNDIDRIRSLNVTDGNIDFSSQIGPCRYVRGESYDIRCAKSDKILESIEKRHVGPMRQALNQAAIDHFKWKIENGE